MKPRLAAIAALVAAAPQTASAAPANLPDLTAHWVGFAALAVFAAAYALVIGEETIDLRKSKPMVVAAGVLWVMIGIVYAGLGLSPETADSFRRVFVEYAELLLFLVVPMSYVNALEERRVFDVLRALLIRSGLSYRTLFLADRRAGLCDLSGRRQPHDGPRHVRRRHGAGRRRAAFCCAVVHQHHRRRQCRR